MHESESFSLAIRYSPPGTAISKYYFTGNLELISSSYKTIYSACISAECNVEGEREKGGETTVIMTATLALIGGRQSFLYKHLLPRYDVLIGIILYSFIVIYYIHICHLHLGEQL